MTSRKHLSPTLLGAGVIAFFFASLVFLPSIFTKRTHNLEFAKSSTSVEFNSLLNTELKVIASSPGFPGLTIGKKVKLSELFSEGDSSSLIINFWATWCPPCLEEFPSLEYLSRQLNSPSRHVRFLTISVDERADDVTKTFSKMDFKPSVLVLHDSSGAAARSVGTTRFPETYWIKSNGTLLQKWIGPQNWLSGDVLNLIASANP